MSLAVHKGNDKSWDGVLGMRLLPHLHFVRLHWLCAEHGGITGINKEFEHIALKALLPALGTGFLVGQPLGQAEGGGEGGTVVKHTELGGPMSHNP